MSGKKGVSGRKTAKDEILVRRESLKAMTVAYGSPEGFFMRIIQILEESDNDANRLKAAQLLADYAFGRPTDMPQATGYFKSELKPIQLLEVKNDNHK